MTTVTLRVTVTTDPVPGAFHTPEQARAAVQRALETRIPHYHPTVTLVREDGPEDEELL